MKFNGFLYYPVFCAIPDEHPVGSFNTPTCPPPLPPKNTVEEAVKPAPADLDDLDSIRSQLEQKLTLKESDSACSNDDNETVLKKAIQPKKKEPKKAELKFRKGRVLETVNMEGLLAHWKAGGFKRIVTMVGAGISTCK